MHEWQLPFDIGDHRPNVGIDLPNKAIIDLRTDISFFVSTVAMDAVMTDRTSFHHPVFDIVIME